MAEPVLSDLYMNEGFEGGADGDVFAGQPHHLGHNMTTVVINKNLLLGLQVFLIIVMLYFLMKLFKYFRKSWKSWLKKEGKGHRSRRSHADDY